MRWLRIESTRYWYSSPAGEPHYHWHFRWCVQDDVGRGRAWRVNVR